jgi:2-hydroxychromene-2-carboxylate isomerase
MAEPIEFWFDFSSPYSYLASERIDELAAKYGRKVKWRAVMIAAAFKVSGLPFLLTVPLKGEYSKRDIERSARFLGLPYAFPSRFPARHAGCGARLLLAARAGLRESEGVRPCGVPRLLGGWRSRHRRAAGGAGNRRYQLGHRRATPSRPPSPRRKSRNAPATSQETDAAIARGMFGVPYIMVDGEPFWGADRLPQIDKWLATGGF